MRTITLITLFVLSTNLTIAQTKIDKAKSNLSESSSKSSTNSSSEGGGSSDGGNGFLESLIFPAFYFITWGTFIGEVQPRTFYDYPYADGQHGEYMRPEIDSTGKRNKFMISNTVVIQSGSWGNDLNLNYRFLPILGIEVNHLHFFDNLDEDTDLGISSAMVNFYRIRESAVTAYWGIGATHVGSGVNTTGFAYNLGMDIYVGNPVSLDLFWKQSFINESSINEFRALARYHLKKLSFHGGFIHYKMGGENFPSAAVGVTYRF